MIDNPYLNWEGVISVSFVSGKYSIYNFLSGCCFVFFGFVLSHLLFLGLFKILVYHDFYIY